MMQLADVLAARRIVVKVGSALLVRDGAPRADWMAAISRELAALRADGAEVIVVSSGAIALGAARLHLPQGGRATLTDAQAAASVGQIELARLWSAAMADADPSSEIAQILLTLDDLENRGRYLNAAATLRRLLALGATPVVNENDSVATEEIRFGDNDRLAARVAQAAGAQAVLLLSDVAGLYDRDPALPDAVLVPFVDGIDAATMAMVAPGSSSGMGTGGMASKLEAARIAERAGIALAIIDGRGDAPIGTARDSGMGTVFAPQRSDRARKAWLGGRLAPAGTLRVDAGCAVALGEGASLLAAGLIGVSGGFRRGDLVTIATMQGAKLAQGLCEYDADECRAVAGRREGEQATVLGYAPRAAVVHRDQLVML